MLKFNVYPLSMSWVSWRDAVGGITGVSYCASDALMSFCGTPVARCSVDTSSAQSSQSSLVVGLR